ncbi:hypothetical protein HG263_04835 [Pseudoalteromonas sp. JBTF-M23]|uniref:Uncharacterized protein n=1 Tax=Pseudoalteromonas caenipelagi TaxID=2726988 RepID=A0A849VAR1_9GAMM|nr:hypothetical protein [Pseudoalteromonas caenipelagi]NOU49860.1 hypothetical protein [Pseudoalteromonas caenipelagi]
MKENYNNISISEDFSYQNLVQIENITRTWFQLMVNLNESTLLRTFFATEQYLGSSQGGNLKVETSTDTLQNNPAEGIFNNWKIQATEYTRHFLTSGLIIYEVSLVDKELVDDEIRQSIRDTNMDEFAARQYKVITPESSQSDMDVIRKLSIHQGYNVVDVHRWAGCGMKIPKTTKLRLDPNIVWPILTFSTTDKLNCNRKYAIENSSNIIKWSVEATESRESGCLLVTNKIVQGQARGSFEVVGEVDHDSSILTLPYTCASFDILTKIKLGQDDDEQLVIFTS